MRKTLAILLALCLCAVQAAGVAETEGDFGVFAAIAGESGTDYVSLFDVILDEQYGGIWQDYCAAVVGEENAEATVAGLQSAISADVYGEEAIAAYGDGSNGVAFDCFFINDVDRFHFEGDTVTVTLKSGEGETHTYEYLGEVNVGEGETMNWQGQEIGVAFPCEAYRSTDEAGEFNYFLLREDTMDTTYHTEFRYGRDLEELQGYFVGPYAYWLAAGIDADADAGTIEDVIALFTMENMDYSAHTDAALGQIADLGLVGEWVADLSPLGEAYADVDLRMTIDEAGHGVTLMNGQQTADFEAYAYDSGEKDDGEGIYIAYSNTEFEAEAAPYALTADEAGNAVLTLTADDGTISWVRQGGEAAQAIEIATAEELAAINDNLSGSYVLTADIDLSGVEWTPIGTFAPSGESEEEQEIPAAEAAFTGTFDGQEHVIYNLAIDQPEGWALGLFGCIANAEVGNFTLENASVDGTVMVADVVGYAYCSTVHDVWLWGGNVTAHGSEMSGEGMYGGIVGAGMASLITDCFAEANIAIPDNTANAGIVGGGLELTSVVNCMGTGSIAAGDNCYGLGGVSGCGFGAEEFTGDTAEDVTITCGDNCFWIGGITGYSGGFELEEVGVPVTAVTGCKAVNVAVTTGENPDGVSAIVGAGFYNEAVAEAMGAPFDQPTSFTLEACEVENVTINGEAAE